MDKSISSTERGRHKKAGVLASAIRALIAGGIAFALCILIIPLIIANLSTPENYISAVAVFVVAVTAFVSAFALQKSLCGHFVMSGISTSLCIILVLVVFALILGKSDADKNFLFSGVLYAVSIVFSILGAKTASQKSRRKKKRTRTR